jgi:hypothetical protein
MEGGVSEGRSVSNYTPGTNRIVPITPGTHGIVPGTSELVRTLIPVTTGIQDKDTSSQRNAHDLDEPRRTTSCRNYSTEGGLAEDRSAPEGVRLVLGILMARTEITPLLVSTSDESADNRSMSRGNSTGMKPDTHQSFSKQLDMEEQTRKELRASLSQRLSSRCISPLVVTFHGTAP